MAGTGHNINLNSQGTRETGFHEPFSIERNTTLPHGEAQTAPGEELNTNVIADKSHRRRPHIPGHYHNKHQQEQRAEQAQTEMYSGLEVHDNPDNGKLKDGMTKRVVNKLSCGTV